MPDQTAKVTLYMTSAHEKVVGINRRNQRGKPITFPETNSSSSHLQFNFGWTLEEKTRFRFFLGDSA